MSDNKLVRFLVAAVLVILGFLTQVFAFVVVYNMINSTWMIGAVIVVILSFISLFIFWRLSETKNIFRWYFLSVFVNAFVVPVTLLMVMPHPSEQRVEDNMRVEELDQKLKDQGIPEEQRFRLRQEEREKIQAEREAEYQKNRERNSHKN